MDQIINDRNSTRYSLVVTYQSQTNLLLTSYVHYLSSIYSVYANRGYMENNRRIYANGLGLVWI